MEASLVKHSLAGRNYGFSNLRCDPTGIRIQPKRSIPYTT